MSRPKNKSQLLQQSDDSFEKLLSYVLDLPTDVQNMEFTLPTLNRNIRDVICHLYHWHGMMQTWYKVGMKGKKPEMPAPGYTWKTTPELNVWIQKHYTNLTLDKAILELQQSHKEVMQLIMGHTNEELFEKKKYRWTGSTSLGAYFVSATCSHYEWGLKLIKKATKAQVLS